MMSAKQKSIEEPSKQPEEPVTSTQPSAESTKHIKDEKKPSALSLFKKKLEQEPSPEERLKLSIEFMKESISQSKAPRFKDFWEAKKLCLPLFKEKINAAVKAKYWADYTELSTEAKRLKDILDEQSSFSMEQLELALQALENDLSEPSKIGRMVSELKFPENAHTLKKRIDQYHTVHASVSTYIQLSARVKELRKEIISTEMRIRHKNKLLKKLSDLGDLFLPKKKELIKQLSEMFLQDVKEFSLLFDLEACCVKNKEAHIFTLREEVKAFQSSAKLIALNSHAFSSSRQILSNCWECLKSADKERKKSFHDKREAAKKNLGNAEALLIALEKFWSENPPKSKSEIFDKVSEVLIDLREIHLFKEDVKFIKAKLQQMQEKALVPFEAEEKLAKEKKELQEQKRLLQKQEFLDLCKSSILSFETKELKELNDLFKSFDSTKKTLKLTEREMFSFGSIKRELYEVILLKEESEIQNISEQRQELENLYSKWEHFKEETRSRLEAFRKEMGSSGFDFEKAMIFRDHVDEEKKRLDRATEKVEQIEGMLD